MNKTAIQTLIDKVIGKKGLIRVPSWWMRKVLMQMADWVQEGDDANGEKIGEVVEEFDEKTTSLETDINRKITSLDNYTKESLLKLKKSLHTQKCFVVKTGANAGYVVVDGDTQSIPANTQKIVTYADTFRFYDNSTTNSGLIFIDFTVTDVSSITDMSYMFSVCSSLTSLDLKGLDTSAVTTMKSMFSYCKGLTSLDLSSFDTSSVTDMSNMFSYCRGLTSLDLKGLDTSSVTDMSNMFSACNGLTSLDLSSFDTSSVTTMNNMFDGCLVLTSLDLSSFDTSSVTDMRYMFKYCHGFTSLDLSSFDTSSVTTMNSMFSECIYITSLNLSSFNTSSVTNMNTMFYRCFRLTSLILGPNFFKTTGVTSIDFSSCGNWTNDTVVTSLVTNSYDRATAGLSTMTLKLSANTKASLTDEQKATITAKGYTIA